MGEVAFIYPEDKWLNEISEIAKAKAALIKGKSPISSLEDNILLLKFWWSKHYNRPMKDPILDEYTLYDLFLEYYLNEEKPSSVSANETIDRHKEEVEDLFKDFDKVGVPDPKPKKEISDEEFLKKEFPKDEDWSMTEKDFL